MRAFARRVLRRGIHFGQTGRFAVWIFLTLLLIISTLIGSYIFRLKVQLESIKDIYLHTLRISLTGSLLETPSLVPDKHISLDNLTQQEFNPTLRESGKDWPLYGLTMIGDRRLRNIQTAIESVVHKRVDGDFVECGVWRGGASIYARAVFNVLGEEERQVHLFDSYNGLPRNSTDRDQSFWSSMSFIAVTYEEVERHLRASRMFGSNIKMHSGFFRYSLTEWSRAIKRKIAVLRLDGDMFESTMDILFNLWEFVPKGGYVIVDDYHAVPEAKSAMEQFFLLQSIKPPLVPIDDDGVYFIKDTSQDIAKEASEWYLNFNQSRKVDD